MNDENATTNSHGTTNQINISQISGGVNNIGSQVENQTVHNHATNDAVDRKRVYDVIAAAVPAHDEVAQQAVQRLLELESGAGRAADDRGGGEPPAEVIESQTILAKYRDQIVAALQEMGWAWLQAAFPQVAFVRPLIQIAIDAWKERNG